MFFTIIGLLNSAFWHSNSAKKAAKKKLSKAACIETSSLNPILYKNGITASFVHFK